MAEKLVNIKVCGSHQHHLGLMQISSEVRHYAYTLRYVQLEKMKELESIWQKPIYLPYLQPKLTDEIIEAAEQKLGYILPNELVELLKIQNGDSMYGIARRHGILGSSDSTAIDSLINLNPGLNVHTDDRGNKNALLKPGDTLIVPNK